MCTNQKYVHLSSLPEMLNRWLIDDYIYFQLVIIILENLPRLAYALLYRKLQPAMLLCSLHPTPPNRQNRRRKNEKISDSSIRYRHHHSNLCLAGSGYRWRRSLVIDLTISSYCKTEKKHRPSDLCFFYVIPL